MTCNKNHRYIEEYTLLPTSQADLDQDRHRCCGCAYLKGFQDAIFGNPQATKLDPSIPESQAGTVRHKDAMTAYIWGYQEGFKRAN